MRVGGRPPAPAGPMAAPGCGHGAFPSRFPFLHLVRDVGGKVTSQCVTRVPCHRGLTAPARRFKPQLPTTHVPSTWRGRTLRVCFWFSHLAARGSSQPEEGNRCRQRGVGDGFAPCKPRDQMESSASDPPACSRSLTSGQQPLPSKAPRRARPA